MISVEEAEQLIAEHVPCFGIEECELARAHGAVLAEPVIAERDQPPFDRVTMDGIAIASSAWTKGIRRFVLQHTQAAGAKESALEDERSCIEIMTGAALPAGCDCVIPVERTQRENGSIAVSEDAEVRSGENVHARGSDYLRDSVLLTPGTIVGAPEMAVLASAGRPTVKVSRKPVFRVVPVGDELVDVGNAIESYQIRRSNDRAMVAGLNQHGFHDVVADHLPDDPAVLAERIATHLHEADVLVLSGGVSMGKYDYIPTIMKDLGVELILHKVSQRPGKPMWFGIGPGDTAVFALPGNPVSALVCFTRYVMPAVAHAMGAKKQLEQVKLASAVEFKPNLTYFLPVKLKYNEWGMAAIPAPTNTSGDFASLAGTTGFVELAKDVQSFPRGYVAPLYRWVSLRARVRAAEIFRCLRMLTKVGLPPW